MLKKIAGILLLYFFVISVGNLAITNYPPRDKTIDNSTSVNSCFYEANRAIIWGSEMMVWAAIWEAANKYNVDFDVLFQLAKCESSLNPVVYGDSGFAYGLFQWHKSSWDLYNKKFGTNLDRYNLEDQCEMTARVLLTDGGYRNWKNCFKIKVLADTL